MSAIFFQQGLKTVVKNIIICTDRWKLKLRTCQMGNTMELFSMIPRREKVGLEVLHNLYLIFALHLYMNVSNKLFSVSHIYLNHVNQGF